MAAAAIPAIIAGVSALAGAFGNKQQSGGTQTPIYDPANEAFRNSLIQAFQSSMNPVNQQNWNRSYELNGVEGFKRTAMNTNTAVQQALAARGLGTTTAGGNALGDSYYRSGSDIGNFLSQAPMIESNRAQGILNNAAGFQKGIPTGINQVGNVNVGGGVGGAVQGGSQGIATYLGQVNAYNNFSKILKQYGSQSPGDGGD